MGRVGLIPIIVCNPTSDILQIVDRYPFKKSLDPSVLDISGWAKFCGCYRYMRVEHINSLFIDDSKKNTLSKAYNYLSLITIDIAMCFTVTETYS